MRANTESVALLAVLGVSGIAHADEAPATTRREQAALRARAEAAIAPALGFRPRLESVRTFEVSSGSVLVGVVSSEQAARVACSDLVRDPLEVCSSVDEDFGVATFVVIRGGTERPTAGYILDEGAISSVRVLDAAAIEADGDAAREFALTVSMLRDGIEVDGVVVLDDDGRVVLDEDIATCEDGGDDGMDCTEGFVSIADDDGDGRAEIVVVRGVDSDETIIDLVVEALDAGPEAENSRLYDVETRRFAYEPTLRAYEPSD